MDNFVNPDNENNENNESNIVIEKPEDNSLWSIIVKYYKQILLFLLIFVIIFVIEKIDGKFGLKQNSSKEKVQYYREHYWKLENLDKPLKAVSSYKSDELKDICKRLHIDCHDMTKPQMYEKILSKL